MTKSVGTSPADDCLGVNDTCCMGVREPFCSILLLFVMSSPKALLGPSACFAGVARVFNKRITGNDGSACIQIKRNAYLQMILVIQSTPR